MKEKVVKVNKKLAKVAILVVKMALSQPLYEAQKTITLVTTLYLPISSEYDVNFMGLREYKRTQSFLWFILIVFISLFVLFSAVNGMIN